MTEKPQKKICRNANIKVDGTETLRELFTHTFKAHDMRCKEWVLLLLAMRGEEVRMYNPKTQTCELFGAKHWVAYLKKHLTKFSAREVPTLKKLFTLMMKTSKTKGFLCPLKSATAASGGDTEAMLICRRLLDEGVLPFKMTENALTKSVYDYSAFQEATSFLASWIEVNVATIERYRVAKEQFGSIVVSAEDLALLGT